MKMRLHYAFLVLFVLMINSCSKETLENTVTVESENAITVEEELLAIVNNYRTSKGYNILNYSAIAYKYANIHTDYMISKGSINHDNFSSRASSIAAEVNASAVSENVAKNYDSVLKVFKNWLASAEHRKAIEGDFTHTAVSIKKDQNGNFYFTQLFYK